MTNEKRDRLGRWERDEAQVIRDQEALVLRLQGCTYAQIAEALGVSVAAAHRMTQRALRDTAPARQVEELRAEQLARLEALWAALWPKVQAGSARHAEVALRVLEREAKLLGLDAPEVKTVEVVTRDAVLRAIEDLERQIIDLGGELPPGDDWDD